MKEITCFKAYDVRGRYPDELSDDDAYRIGRAYASFVAPKTVAVGRDIRASSDAVFSALSKGLTDSGVDVYDIGVCGTELVYFATFSRDLDGGIMITASHNPPEYNGMKMVREKSKPISDDTGLKEIRRIAESNEFHTPKKPGNISKVSVNGEYISHLLSYVDIDDLKPLKIVVDAGNGCAGPYLDMLEEHLPFEFIKLHHEPDGSFPNGVPNPMLEGNRGVTAQAVRDSGADFGIAWDGDFDRCFLFDENGAFIEGYYIVGLLAQTFLQDHARGRIVHDPRLTWNTLDIVAANGGHAELSKSGHAFMKQTMREADAVYGGEMSAHHYFRDFSYADSGMIPWLLIAEILSSADGGLSSLVTQRVAKFPSSGEINRRVDDAGATIKQLESVYCTQADRVDHLDGLSMEFADWRFNLRASNTEPLIRLNVESRGDEALMKEKTDELLGHIGGEAE